MLDKMAQPTPKQSMDSSLFATASSLVQALFSMESPAPLPVTPSLASNEQVGNPEMDLNCLSQLLMRTAECHSPAEGIADKLSGMQPSSILPSPLLPDATSSNLASSFSTSIPSSSLLLNPPTVQTLKDSKSGGDELQPAATTPQLASHGGKHFPGSASHFFGRAS